MAASRHVPNRRTRSTSGRTPWVQLSSCRHGCRSKPINCEPSKSHDLKHAVASNPDAETDQVAKDPKTCVAIPSDHKRILSDADEIMEKSTDDEIMEMSTDDEHSSSNEENSSTVQCSLCLPVPRTLDTPPLACLERGDQVFNGWWRKNNRQKVLGPLKETMVALAQQCLQAVQAPRSTTLRVLSLSDGSVDEEHNMVPTSVLLAHAFASLGVGALPRGIERVKIVGGDAANPGPNVKLQTKYCLPSWLELQHVRLNNMNNFQPQLFKFGHCVHASKFDVILMRQGLCYCKDHSFNCLPPEKLELVGVKGEDTSDGPSGSYVLEQNFRNGRPSYRKGHFLLRWRPARNDWIVEEDTATNYVWANVNRNCGSPALAQEPWYVWNGKDYVVDWAVSCEVTDTSPPWKRPPRDCKCCGGISLNAGALQDFMGRVATALDERQPKAFALLHSGFYTGTQDEVKEFQLELESAAELFNSTNPCILASVLKREDTEDWSVPYWKRIDGLLLSPNLA